MLTSPKTIKSYLQLRRNRTEKPAPFSEYINSAEWKTMRKYWAKQAGGYCQMFPWLPAVRDKFEIHHISDEAYSRLGKEELNQDVLVLSRFAHQWVFHFLLSFGIRRPGRQKEFPNGLQKAAIYWCRRPRWIKMFIVRFVFLTFLATWLIWMFKWMLFK